MAFGQLVISAELIRRKNACQEELALFIDTFGHGTVHVTEALCIEHGPKFNMNWAADNLLSQEGLALYMAEKVKADAVYNAAKQPALAEYDASYSKDIDTALATYMSKINKAQAVYKATLAKAFGIIAEGRSEAA
jgi:hypothetical protein